MAKKSMLSGNRLYLIAGGGAVVAAVLVAVFVFGVGLDFVKPLYEPLLPLTTQEVQENNQVVIDINDVPKDLSDQYANGELGNIPPEELDQMIQDQIQNLTESANPTEITNQTEFSDDPPTQQIVETLIPPTLDLISRVTKIDSTGARETVEKVTKIGSLSLFIEELSKKDYSSGFLETQLLIKGKPSLFYKGTGNFDIIIGGSPSTTPINLSIDGQADADGLVPIKFVTANGLQSDLYTFNFANNIGKFPEAQISKLSFNSTLLITETQTIQCITTPCDPIETQFGITDAELFTMDIRKDANLIVITDQQGVSSLAYPTDSKIILTSKPTNIYGYSCVIGKVTESGSWGKTSSGNPNDCLINQNAGNSYGSTGTPLPAPSVLAGTIPAPSMTGVILLDNDGKVLVTKPGGTGEFFNELVTRNQNYTLTISSPAQFTGHLSYGKTQETKSYSCWQTGTPKYANSNSYWSGAVSGCGFTGTCGNFAYTYYLSPNGYNLGAVQCNLP